ncbi:MAG: hypothetical protein CMN30_20735 [Sandaracinus sp.]|nr:hypothetical protein [Sandaracinus sp.]
MTDEASATTPPDVLALHAERERRHTAEADRLEAKATKLSIGRLVLFLAAIVLGGAGFSGSDPLLIGAGAGALVAFFVLVVLHAKTEAARDEARARAEVHARHQLRADARFLELPVPTTRAVPDHPYASDIDLTGPGSLVQRIDVSRTVPGERALVALLSEPVDRPTIELRQEGLRELAADLDFRESLEAYGARADGKGKLDPTPFLKFTRRAPVVTTALAVVIHVFPLAVLGAFVAASLGLVTNYLWLGLLGVQVVLALGMGGRAIDAFQLVAARRGYVEALQKMLVLADEAAFEAPLLKAIQERLRIGEQRPRAYMARLDRWAGFAEFYTQFPLHFFVNLATLYDLHVLLRLERWNREVGTGLEGAFAALAELEAAASLATLAAIDPGASFPTVHAEPRPLTAEGLAHPLLAPGARVANDVRLPDISGALIVTGSNMAGKSTLLRSVGLNIALALAGGPVIARRFDLSPVRLRASMRIDDSLQRGASYFHAELTKLRTVVGEADADPPIFFLLDELLRGTNARARHIGARAVLQHLLARGASGLAATHDIALAKLEDEYAGRIQNVHFTDVMREGAMIFDYRLREGVVRTSNALRLLQMAGVEVDVDDQVSDEEGPGVPASSASSASPSSSPSSA